MAQDQKSYVEMLTDSLLHKLHLVGIGGQGIERTFVTDIKGDMVGAIALRLCSEDIDSGMYFDMSSLKFYHTYDEVSTAAFVKECAEQRALAEAPKASI